MKKLFFLATIFLAIFAFSQKTHAADWSTPEALGNMGGIGLPAEISGFLSLKTDSNNKVHISYWDATNNDLKYVTNTSGSWATEIVDVGNVWYLDSLAIDSNNKIHIAYLIADAGDTRLTYANNTSGIWQIATLDSSIEAISPSIAIDSNNKAHIAYQDRDNDRLKYATNSSGDWSYTTLDATPFNGMYNSLALDSNNKVHVSYYHETDNCLKYVTNASEDWVITVVDNSAGAGYFNSLALDSNNKAHISYLYYVHPSYTARYATNATSDGTWSISDIDSSSNPIFTGAADCLALDSNNKVRISYYEYSGTTHTAQIKYATNVSGTFEKFTLSDSDNVGHPSMDVDARNRTHIAYYDVTTQQLKYTYTPGTSSNSLSISSIAGTEYTISRDVNLSLSAQGDPTQIMISENADFEGASWETYTASKDFTLSSKEGKKTIYAKFRDAWHAESDTVSDSIRYIKNPKFVTKSAKKTNEVLITKKNKKYSAQDFDFIFKLFPKKIKKTKYYLQSTLFSAKYPKTFKSPKKQIIKKYWKFTDNLNKYKVKKKNEKYKVKMVFTYSGGELSALKKKNKSIKEKNLKLKYYNPQAKKWINMKATQDKTANTFTIYLSEISYKTIYFAIGVK